MRLMHIIFFFYKNREEYNKLAVARTDLSITADLHLAVLVPLVVKVVSGHEGDISSGSGQVRRSVQSITDKYQVAVSGTSGQCQVSLTGIREQYQVPVVSTTHHWQVSGSCVRYQWSVSGITDRYQVTVSGTGGQYHPSLASIR